MRWSGWSAYSPRLSVNADIPTQPGSTDICSAAKAQLFDHFVGEREQLGRIGLAYSITGGGQYIRFPPGCWRSLHRAQASGADRRRACPATGDIPALA